MADVKAARAEIQKVVAFLVNRFGPEVVVFEYLTRALEHLKAEPVVSIPSVQLVEDGPEPEVATTTTETDAEAMFTVKPRGRRSRK